MYSGKRHCATVLVIFLWFLIALLLTASGVIAAAPRAQPSPNGLSAAVPASCSNLVLNGDFEQGPGHASPWVLGGFTEISDHWPRGGDFGVWMGDYQNADDTLYQLVTIPADSDTVQLRYWWSMHSFDDVETAYDYLHAALQAADGTPLADLETLDNTAVRDAWTQSSFDLSDCRGMSLRIHFRCTGNEQFNTGFFLDDVELEVCKSSTPTPTDTWTPTATSTGTLTDTPTATPTATWTVTPTSTPSATATPTSMWTATPTPLPTETPTSTPSPTATPTATWTAMPTSTPSATVTATPSATATTTPTASLTPTSQLTTRSYMPLILRAG